MLADLRLQELGILPQLALGGGFLGLASHLGYFIRGEHHLRAFEYFIGALTSPALACLGLLYYQTPVKEALTFTSVFFSTYYLGLFSSIFVYRAVFHRLRSFPGPFAAGVTKFWHVNKVVRKLDNYKFLDRIHNEYGEYVRLGRIVPTI
jgi:hypothetical protein